MVLYVDVVVNVDKERIKWRITYLLFSFAVLSHKILYFRIYFWRAKCSISAELKPAYGGKKHRRFAPDYGRFAPEKELAYGEQNIRPN